MNLRLINTAAGFGLVVLVFYMMHIASSLILPLVIALVVWYLIMQFTRSFERIKINDHCMPRWLSFVISILLSAIIIYLFTWLCTYSITNIIGDTPKYQQRLQFLLDHINKWTGTELSTSQLLGKINFSQLFSRLALIISDALSNITLILIYLLFLLLEVNTFDTKVAAMCGTKQKYAKVKKVLTKIQDDVNAFFKVKVLMNGLAGFLSYLCLLSFHVNYAEFWGVFIFLLHFIPFIGPILAVLFVLLAASIQINSLLAFILLAIILTAIQFIVGNLLEPKLMGDKLDLSPLVILLSLAFWGYIWGIMGMFLCVPLMVIIAIIFANFPQTRIIAVVLSAKGTSVENK